LRIDRLLHPKRAVIVEDRDAAGGRDEIRAALGADGGDEVENGALRRAVPPGGQRVGTLGKGGDRQQQRGQGERRAARGGGRIKS
jgi:hypothetical protein